MADRFSCAIASAAAGEPLYGTASQVRRWILVEQPGAWGIDAVLQSDLPIEIATRLRAVARAQRARLLLIRRHGRSDAAATRSCFVVVSTADVRRVERFPFDDPAELLEVDWAPLRLLEAVGGEPVDEPLYLVCTNGSHDTCCARFGRPVAAVLSEAFSSVWESSHFGGDRFAGNVVCLPDGIYYGRVDPADAVHVVSTVRSGELSMPHYRGRSFEPFVAQAAEHFVRESRGLFDVDAVIPEAVTDTGDGTFSVTLSTATGDRLTARVAVAPAETAEQLTCRSTTPEHPPRYRLLGLD